MTSSPWQPVPTTLLRAVYLRALLPSSGYGLGRGWARLRMSRVSDVRSLSVDRDLVDDLAVRCRYDDVRCLHGSALVAVVRPPDVRYECDLLDAE